MGRQTLCLHHPGYPALSTFQTAETIKQVAWSSMKTRVHPEATFVLSLQAWTSTLDLQKIHLGSPAPKTQPLPTGISGSLVSLLGTAPGLQSCRPALPSPGGKALNEEGLSPAGGRKPSSVPREPESLLSRWDSGQETSVYTQPPAITEQVTREVAHGVHLQQPRRLRSQTPS